MAGRGQVASRTALNHHHAVNQNHRRGSLPPAMDVLLPEWSPRRALILRWPWRTDIWPFQAVAAQQAVVDTLCRLQPLLQARSIQLVLQVHSSSAANAAEQLKTHQLSSIQLDVVDYADIWVRDCAPFYVQQSATCSDPTSLPHEPGRVVSLLTGFNGWGGLDPDFADDLAARDWLCKRYQLDREPLDLVLEGGSLHTNGEGLLLYVASSVLEPKRNPTLNQETLHQLFRDSFAARNIIALAQGLVCDETGGHADNLLTFLSPRTLAVTLPDDPMHPEYEGCQQTVADLRQQLSEQQLAVELLPLPMPQLQLSEAEALSIRRRSNTLQRPPGMPLCASYCNGIRLGDIYAMPTFGVPEDALARGLIEQAEPRLTVIELPARALLPGGGGWHCASHAVV
ncbi:hypothetical protein CWE12_11245 [Aliidiomarina sedimenti]|uniref:Agmatine deiminase n=2 Tax=Aliidiomarina sedimenti TaxID=1933879 RepID=A0ABY0BX28_9GAMM|nr:hypothetical protein CWE12_11245 [Aliidiomarina sedimenti]